MKILIIDDDARNIFALSAVLKARRYSCVSALSVRDALEVLRDNADVGIILLDMMMPDMDGYQAIALFKQYEAYRHLPIVAVTAQAMPGDKEKCLEAGADAYVSKPVDIDLLIQVLTECLLK